MKQPNLALAQQLLADFWLDNITITVKAFWNDLKQEYPDHIWTTYWVKHFLDNSGLSSTNNGTFKSYHRNRLETLSTLLSTPTVEDDEYYSSTKQQVLKINSLDTTYVRNILLKKYPNVTLQYVLENPLEEVSKLVKQYFK